MQLHDEKTLRLSCNNSFGVEFLVLPKNLSIALSPVSRKGQSFDCRSCLPRPFPPQRAVRKMLKHFFTDSRRPSTCTWQRQTRRVDLITCSEASSSSRQLQFFRRETNKNSTKSKVQIPSCFITQVLYQCNASLATSKSSWCLPWHRIQVGGLLITSRLYITLKL